MLLLIIPTISAQEDQVEYRWYGDFSEDQVTSAGRMIFTVTQTDDLSYEAIAVSSEITHTFKFSLIPLDEGGYTVEGMWTNSANYLERTLVSTEPVTDPENEFKLHGFLKMHPDIFDFYVHLYRVEVNQGYRAGIAGAEEEHDPMAFQWDLIYQDENYKIYSNPERNILQMVIGEARYKAGISDNNELWGLLRSLSSDLLDITNDDHNIHLFVLDEARKPDGLAWGMSTLRNRAIKGIGYRPRELDQNLFQALIMTRRDGIIKGPMLHELMHAYANFITELFDPEWDSHWGFSSVNGQLGGFDLQSLVEISPGVYEADDFGVLAQGGNSTPYGDLELYLMGLIPASDVEDIWVGRNGNFLVWEGDRFQFTVEEHQWLTMDDIISHIGEREPAFPDSPDEFSILPVLISPSYNDYENRDFADGVEWLTFPGEDDSASYNFYEATRGLGKLNLAPVHFRESD
ncbi:MAG: hypothetical protein D6B26_04445 [Spirochaetaceae bacterium]|nr:MAG: hypothetical protein D6B26_04445 [Spirochaetaceae bacterium]